MRSLREMHDIVSFTKDGQKITGVIADFFYDQDKNVIVKVKEQREIGNVYYVRESELD